jgi:hypothetical protein
LSPPAAKRAVCFVVLKFLCVEDGHSNYSAVS